MHDTRTSTPVATPCCNNTCWSGQINWTYPCTATAGGWPWLLKDFDPTLHALFEDVELGVEMGFITIKDHKTKRRSD